MSIRCYHPHPLKANMLINLSERLVRHLQVLRVKVGTNISLFDGQGQEISASIITMNKKTVSVSLLDDLRLQAPAKFNTHLGQALCRFDRMDFIIQKAVELNVSAITPLYAERSQGRLKPAQLEAKLLHWQEVIINACEQCGQNYLPQLHPPMTVDDWLNSTHTELKLNFTPDKALSLKKLAKNKTAFKTCALMIGPEGGLNPDELAAADRENFQRIGLGPRILRVETAAILALGCFNYQFDLEA